MTPDPAVIVVGGGPVGLAAAIALSRAGVRWLLVERHRGTAIHPKARGVDVRTMEVFRQWGLEAAVREAGLPAEEHGFFFRGATLTSRTFERFGGGGRSDDARRFSPTTWLVIGQDALEPVLLSAVADLGLADVRFGHELTGLEQNADGVTATILERSTGRTSTVSSGWVIGADGAGSRVREILGVGLDGHGPLVWNASILFRADLGRVIADRQSAVYYLAGPDDARPRGYPMSVGNPPPNGVLLTINNADRWLLVIGLPTGNPAPPGPDEARAHVVRALGDPTIGVEVLGVLPWTPAARVATRYRVGRAFLAGDAAHEMTPSGAFGLNVGIQDAHNLGWKVGAVVRGVAGPGLLDSYEAERQPIARFATEQSYRQFTGERAARPFGNWGVILGLPYASGAVVADGSSPPETADPAVDYVPVARPGHRAPHAWLGPDGGQVSTIDLLGDGFTVLGRDARWEASARLLAERLGAPVVGRVLGGDLEPADGDAFERAYGIGRQGAVLVRPDGCVAWRGGDPDDLDGALRTILDRPRSGSLPRGR